MTGMIAAAATSGTTPRRINCTSLSSFLEGAGTQIEDPQGRPTRQSARVRSRGRGSDDSNGGTRCIPALHWTTSHTGLDFVATTHVERPILSGRISAFQRVKSPYLGKILATA